MKNLFFVLGAPDHEMQEIARICEAQNIPFGFAIKENRHIVHTHEAYHAVGVSCLIPKDAYIVTVECAVRGLPVNEVVDHHQQGDPGYGKEPAEYLEGSSLGQVLKLLNLTPTPQQRIIAAADHCLMFAYQGLCPGVSPEALCAWREESRALSRGVTKDLLRTQIQAAMRAIEEAPKIVLANETVAWFEEPPLEIAEASARTAQPYTFMKKQDDGRVKAGIRSAPFHVVKAWLELCGLRNTYGDPARGFAGGYF
jgi:hypothetical protein